MIKQIQRMLYIYIFLLKNNGLNVQTIIAAYYFTLLMVTKHLGYNNARSRYIWKNKSLQLTIKGFKIICKTGHVGIIEEQFVLRKLPIPKGDVIDCGANIGLFTLGINNYVDGRILCIEPDTRNFEVLIKNLKNNNVFKSIALKVAVSDHVGTAEFSSTPVGIGSYLLKKDRVHNGLHEPMNSGETVQITTIDNLVKKNKIRPAYIKIDVEGHEIEVLNGSKNALKKFRPMIIVEIHNKRFIEEIQTILTKAKYSTISMIDSSTLLAK